VLVMRKDTLKGVQAHYIPGCGNLSNMYTYEYIRTNVYTHICVCVHMYIYGLCAKTSLKVFKCIVFLAMVRLFICVYIYIHMHANKHVYVFIHMCV